jgi:uncharacterized protein YndB with AHSA1/START domain
MKKLFFTWFGLKTPVSRTAYLASGVAFMVLKFAIESSLFAALVGRELTLGAFLSPFFLRRAELLRGAPDGVTWALLGLTLPFLWMGVSMSVRRALDAGLPPMLGFLFLIPGVHYLLMAGLCVAPTRDPASRRPVTGIYREGPPGAAAQKEAPRGLRAVRAILASSTLGFLMFGICVYVFRSYGATLFLATPFMMGVVATSSYLGTRIYKADDVEPTGTEPLAAPSSAPDPGLAPPAARTPDPEFPLPMRGAGGAAGCVMASLVITAIGLLCFAFEGGACIGMAVVPAGVLATLGSLLAMAIQEARTSSARSAFLLVALPLAAGAESALETPPLNEVVSSVIVDAPPEIVWKYVTSFPDLAPPTEWMFQHGIAYPIRARIEGEGVGAIRYCEFSTGDFVEPITRWEAPHRLSFDVAKNPPPMREWSFWDRVEAPHLHGFMDSKRGEFRLIALPGNRTRLEGSTFYQLEIYPELYWKVWTDSILHAVHGRVLHHIQRLSEEEARLGR